jgi:hypothetical protein
MSTLYWKDIMAHDPDRCTSRGCTRRLTNTTVTTARDGNRYCKRHGDRLPPYLRKPQRAKKQKVTQ